MPSKRKIKLSLAFVIIVATLLVLALAFNSWVLTKINPFEGGFESTIKGSTPFFLSN